MSALFGIINLEHQPVDPASLGLMSMALADHGADTHNIWTQGPVGLGQRLMRFTPQDSFERQPLVSADKSRVLISDARIDNRDELMSGFEFQNADSGGSYLKSQIPDSALILRAYETWGADCVGHLVGVFAFAIWDARTQTLFAARSPIVAPSLVYYASPQVFAFATMPSGLHALAGVPRALDEQRLADSLAHLGGYSQATLYRDISRLPTGHRLIAGRNGTKIENYWRPDLKREFRFARDEECWGAFNDLFARIVGDYLRSLTPVAVQMSGGLDSSAVAVTAARLLQAHGERLTAFTEVPRAGFAGAVIGGRYADETLFVRAIAEMYSNLDLNLVRTDGQTFLSDLDCMFAHLQAPFRNTSNRVWIEAILQQTSQLGMRVLLDGVQGNLTMSWNGSGLIPELIRSGKWASAFRQAGALARHYPSSSALRMLMSQGILPLLPDPLWLAVDWVRHPESRAAQPWFADSVIHPDFAAAQRVAERAREKNNALRFRPIGDSRQVRYEALANQDFGAYLSAYRAMYGVDMRTPSADVRLAEFCLALSEDQYLRDGESRRLIRRGMAERLPTVVLANQQRGLQAADWFERLVGARPQIAETLAQLEQSELARRVLDLKRMRQMFEQMPSDEVGDFKAISDYRFIFEPGLMVGRFLCWFEAGA